MAKLWAPLIDVALVLGACTDSPFHSNPLDPASPDYSINGRMAGRIMTFYQPYQPIAQATIELQPNGLVARSGADGRFVFADLAPDSYFVSIVQDGFSSLMDTLVIAPRGEVIQDFHLNGLPFVQGSRIISSKVATREAPSPLFFLDIAAELQDPDGANDICRVVLNIPMQSFRDTLAPAIGVGQWQRTFIPEELASLDMGKLVGAPLQFIVYDIPGAEVISQPFFLTRLISEEAETIEPINGNVALSAPTFRWQLPNIAFSYTQRLEIYRLDAGFPTLVTAISNIQSDVKSLPYLGRLSAGSYFWTLRIIDDFGNSSRSKEASFVVE